MCGTRKPCKATRDAAHHWHKKCSGSVREIGLDIGVSPCYFDNKDWDV